jgi:hypothetical protein
LTFCLFFANVYLVENKIKMTDTLIPHSTDDMPARFSGEERHIAEMEQAALAKVLPRLEEAASPSTPAERIEAFTSNYGDIEFSRAALQGEMLSISLEDAWGVSADYLAVLEGLDNAKDKELEGRTRRMLIKSLLEESMFSHSQQLAPEHSHAYVRCLKSLLTSDHQDESSPQAHVMAMEVVALSHGWFLGSLDDKGREEYISMLRHPNFIRGLGGVLTDPQTSKHDFENFHTKIQFFNDVLRGIGFEYEDDYEFTRSWQYTDSATGEHMISTRSNMITIANLERDRPGGAALLHNFYGIRGFHRYPYELLVKQIDEHGSNKPYGIVVGAADDNNNAHGANHRLIVPAIKLGERYALRITEHGSKEELGEMLAKLDELYGDEHPISFGIVTPHGWKHGLAFRDYAGSMGHLSTADVRIATRKKPGDATRGIKDYFVEHPTFVFQSCSTGQERGIAQAVSRGLRATVVAPEEDTATEGFVVRFNADGTPRILPAYKVPEGKRNLGEGRLIKPVLYDRGKRITGEEYARYFRLAT